MSTQKFRYILLLFTMVCISNPNSSANFFGKTKANIDTFMISINHKQADKKFEGLAYAKAIDKYEKIVAKGFAPDSLRRNLAYSYYMVKETQQAEEIYQDLVRGENTESADIYNYAQVLKYNNKYDQADEWIEKYRELNNVDTRGQLQFEAAPVIEDIYSEERYRIEPAYFNSEYSDFGAVVVGEEIIFTSGRNDQAMIQYEYSWKGQPYLDLYAVSIEKPAIYKSANMLSKGINSRYHDGPACYNSEGKEVFLTRNTFNLGMPTYSEEKENHFMIYHGNSSGNGWEDLTEMPFNSKEYSCGHPSISADNNTLYFASDMPGGYGESDIYYVKRTETGWSDPINLGPDVNTEGDEMFPYISTSGKLYFASNGHLGLGGLDVYGAEPLDKDKYEILNMGYPLNSSSDDFSFYIMDDGVSGYFASNREGGKGDDDIYHFTMLRAPDVSLALVATCIDKASGEIITNAEVLITDNEGTQLFKGKSDALGQVRTEIKDGGQYKLSAGMEKYLDSSVNLIATKEAATDKTISIEIPLEGVAEWGVFGLIYEKESGEGITDVEIIISEKNGANETHLLTDESGNFRNLLKAETSYDILLRKKKYFTRRGKFSTIGMAPGWIDVKEFIEVEMEEIVVGKTIEIPNIYYDVSKWDIRSDAAVELDKVVQFLLDNESITIELGSHTDARGSNSSNQTLSQKRAESAVNYIVSKGIAQDRITAKGYGESKLKNRCVDGVKCSDEEHQENRRTEIRIVGF